ncbi:MAG TPA: stage II sporulation protein E, partial [Firmicutes bacterium]|nr:stage II sporulation protein E [Bacillota bacterium]
HLIEYDNPSLLWIRKKKPLSIKRKKRQIAGKETMEAQFFIEPGDLLVMISDGVINAGVGGLFRLGLGYEGVINSVLDWAIEYDDSQPVAERVTDVVDACYLGRPGDDSTSIIITARNPRTAILLTGPPANPKHDQDLVSKFLEYKNVRRIICGGATGNLVAREMGREIKTNLKYEDPSVPPTATIKGIDLVTEGILTLNKCLTKLKNIDQDKKTEPLFDGATLLCQSLMKADRIIFLVGTAVNPAHEEFMNSLQLLTRMEVIKRLQTLLTEMDKEVVIEKY